MMNQLPENLNHISVITFQTFTTSVVTGCYTAHTVSLNVL